MGDIANHHVNMLTSGRWGIPQPSRREFPKTTKAAIAGQRFSVVEVTGGRTNRIPGTKLVVCDQDDTTYWVWASKDVTGIAKDVCKVLHADLALNEALSKMGRKVYPHQEAVTC